MSRKRFSRAGSRGTTAIPTESKMKKARIIPIFSFVSHHVSLGRNSGMIFSLSDEPGGPDFQAIGRSGKPCGDECSASHGVSLAILRRAGRWSTLLQFFPKQYLHRKDWSRFEVYGEIRGFSP